MPESQPTLIGRSSSHYTRVARLFALELSVPHAFQPVLDITTRDPTAYGENPALKVPVWRDAEGSLFGLENICRELARRSGQRERVVLRGDSPERLVANAEELVAHAMGSEVILIMNALCGPNQVEPPKVRASMNHALAFLDAHWAAVLAALPPDRLLSFCEAALFCVFSHLPFRKVADVGAYRNLAQFCAGFAERASARATEYCFDSA